MNTAHTLHARCVCTLYARRVLQVGVLCGVALGACVKEPRNAQRAVLALATLGSIAMTALAVPPPCRKRRLGGGTAMAWLPRPPGPRRRGTTQGLGSGRLGAPWGGEHPRRPGPRPQ